MSKPVRPVPLFALTGGIAAGKSTVAERLAERGAAVIDADVIARTVVEPGRPALAAVVEAFGEGILTPEGRLDRPALGARVFGDAEARERLNGILHPAIREEAVAQTERARAQGAEVILHDIPLLAETGRGPEFAFAATVEADDETRISRMVRDRGMTAEDAAARIAAQATRSEREEIADAVLENTGSREELTTTADALWNRMRALSRNVTHDEPAQRIGGPALVPAAERDWVRTGRRLCARIAWHAGDLAAGVEHVGSTAVPGLEAKDVVDLQLEAPSWDAAERLAEPLAAAGFVRRPDVVGDTPHGGLSAEHWRKAFYQNADPGQAVNLHVRVSGTASLEFARVFRDALCEDGRLREEYRREKRRLAREHAGEVDTAGYAEAKEAWFERVAWPVCEARVLRRLSPSA
ncbi:dephospho-CoA kinase [Arthrobacter sp. UM1]|uniref:dephospho-CoA kinase n=1 Tax=Arthrobacter sp. UM1 TaxID=2766776 RepID=UPI001CF6FF89|nr:dephospho-CoA kinase [Arthrobacter sp. UM1]MCB4207431.1 dephospho-CoA kinase [Arthrobacter sp. UM1]